MPGARHNGVMATRDPSRDRPRERTPVDTSQEVQTREVRAAVVADAVAVLVFALVGRRSHGEGSAAAGVLLVAWPFLAGAVAGWFAARALRLAPQSLRGGGVVLVTTVALGMLLRGLLTDRGLAVSFVVVALVALGVMMLGWRALVALGARRAAR